MHRISIMVICVSMVTGLTTDQFNVQYGYWFNHDHYWFQYGYYRCWLNNRSTQCTV